MSKSKYVIAAQKKFSLPSVSLFNLTYFNLSQDKLIARNLCLLEKISISSIGSNSSLLQECFFKGEKTNWIKLWPAKLHKMDTYRKLWNFFNIVMIYSSDPNLAGHFFCLWWKKKYTKIQKSPQKITKKCKARTTI